MIRRKLLYAAVILIFSATAVQAQFLDRVAPVTITKNNLPAADSPSFILSAVDYNFYIGKGSLYSNTLQVVDADRPWPPRWFTCTPFNDKEYTLEGETTALLDASVQNGKTTFFSLIDTKEKEGEMGRKQAYLSLDKKMFITDTFTTPERAIDGHDFKVSASGDKLYFLPGEKTADMSSMTHDAKDNALKVYYEEIQIADKSGKVIFRWNPIDKLGLDATHLPYRYVEALISNRDQYGWSHGNSLAWDEDGNILYSFKNIGIGKISRANGRIIWRIDRNKQKINKYSDELPIYLQHSFQWVKAQDGNNYYTVLSNGDSLHPHSIAYHFTVKMEDNHPVVKVVNTIKGAEDLPNTLGGGNYDAFPNGNYLFNYGAFWAKDMSVPRPVFEYGDKTHLLSQYGVPATIICYKVHTYENSKPERPVITANGNILTANGLKVYMWYRLSGKDLKTVTKLSAGPMYKAIEKGFYCVTAKCGIGTSTSEVFEVK